MKLRNISILFSLILASGCGKDNVATIEGQFFGYANNKIAIEKIMPGVGGKIIDTLSTDSDGAFSVSVEFEKKTPVFYNVRTTDSYVPLLLASGENVKVSSVGNIYNNYKVSGSEGSETLLKLNQTTTAQLKSLDSIGHLFNPSLSKERVTELSREYGRGYINLKRQVITFVISHPHSLASIVPLYQPMIDGRFIFDEPSDIVYYKAIADSLASRYPDSPYVLSLQEDVAKSEKTFSFDSTLQAKLGDVNEVSILPIELKDAEGQTQKLTDLVGKKVILLDFVALEVPEMKIRNREMAEIYDKYKDQGFEIFQVSVDQNKAQWLNAVVDARLQWISVNDPEGRNSSALRTYNVNKLPSNFLISLDGDIVKRDISSPKDLDAQVAKLIR